jgi:farnesyl diphosphate synthase
MPASVAGPNPGATSLFDSGLAAVAAEIETLLDDLLAEKPGNGEITRPARLLDAMRYACLSGGKRLRPFLVVETARLFGVERRHALITGAAVECVHTYSLIHDDLPAMDDDELRRGRPTVHKAFDEATAILAGDALLTFAFDLLSRPQTHPDPAVRITLVSELARAAGLGGMAGGQLLDLAAEGRFGGAQPRPSGEDEIGILEAMKTGALLRAACLAGAILGQAAPAARDALDRYGSALGQAFQIADDLLDLEGDTATVGKTTGKDAAAGKATLVGILGPEGARTRLGALIADAEAALSVFGGDAAMLRAAAHFVADRPA